MKIINDKLIMDTLIADLNDVKRIYTTPDGYIKFEFLRSPAIYHKSEDNDKLFKELKIVYEKWCMEKVAEKVKSEN